MTEVARPEFYITGGTLGVTAPCYVERRADSQLFEALRAGEYCYVLTARQMGKSSLMARTADRLCAAGFATAVLDLTALGQNVSAEQWYAALTLQTARQVGGAALADVALDAYHSGRSDSAPVQRWIDTLCGTILAAANHGQLAVFIDEIDFVRSLPFPADEFFASIRECHNRRVRDVRLHRLTFCLLGVASPSELISNPECTPFNIGRRIDLEDFTVREAAVLAMGFAGGTGDRPAPPDSEARRLLERVLYWTSGQPYLTQRLCAAVAENLRRGQSAEVDRCCRDLFFLADANHRDSHLAFVRNTLLRPGVDVPAVLDLYRKLRRNPFYADAVRRGPVVAPTDASANLLLLVGLVRRVALAGRPLRLAPRNRIYWRVFDGAWISDNLPNAELRRQKAAYLRGVARATVVAAAVVSALAFSETRTRDYALRLASEFRKGEDLIARLKHQTRIAGQEAARARRAQEAAERQAGEAERQAGEAERARNLAERNARAARSSATIAENERRNALLNRDHSLRNLAQVYTTRAHRLVEEGDLLGALPWFIQALQVDVGRTDREELHRTRIGTLLRCAPRLIQLASAGGEIVSWQGTPDGGTFAICNADGTVHLWEPRTEAEPRRRIRLPVAPAACAIDRAGRRIAVVCKDGTAHIWDPTRGSLVTAGGHRAYPLTNCAVSDDGGLLAAGGPDGIVHLWNVEKGCEPRGRITDGEPVVSLRFCPDGRRLLIAGSRSARLWDSHSGRPLTRPMRHNGEILSIATSRDGTRVVTASGDGTARVWNAGSGELVVSLAEHRGPVYQASFSPDGNTVLTAGGDRTARLWDARSGIAAGPPLVHPNVVLAASFCGNSRRVVTTCWDRTTRTWDAQSGARLASPLPHGSPVLSAVSAADGRWIVTATRAGLLHVWDMVSPRPGGATRWASATGWRNPLHPDGSVFVGFASGGTHLLSHRNGKTKGSPLAGPREELRACFSADGSRIALATVAGRVRVIDTRSGRQCAPILTQETRPSALAFSPSALRVATGDVDGVIRTWEIPSGRILSRTPRAPEHEVFRIVFNPEGSRVAVVRGLHNRATQVGVWEVGSGRPVGRLGVAPNKVLDLIWPPSGPLALFLSRDETAVQVWDLSSGRPRTGWLRHPAHLWHATFTPNGRIVTTGSDDLTARVWDVGTGKLLFAPLPHQNAVVHVACTPDGKRLATGAGDGTVRLWDLRSGEALTPPLHHPQVPTECLLSRHGDRLLTILNEGAAQGWDLTPDPRSLEELARVAKVLSARSPGAGGPVPLEAGEQLAAWKALNRASKAVPDLEEDLDPAQQRLRLAALERAGNWQEALTQVNRILKTEPHDLALVERRARAAAELGDWKLASADYARLCTHRRGDPHLFYRRALTSLAVGDISGYQQGCQRMLARYSNTAGEIPHGLVIWTCVLGSPASLDLSAPLMFAQRSLAEASVAEKPDRLGSLGALLYRAGQHEAAIRALEVAVEGQPNFDAAITQLFLAMARHRAGRTREARQSLATARRRLRLEGTLPRLDWEGRLETHLLVTEAAAVLRN